MVIKWCAILPGIMIPSGSILTSKFDVIGY